MTENHLEWSGYIVQRQPAPSPGGAISYSVTRRADGVGLGAYFSLEPGGDVDQVITADKAAQAVGVVGLPHHA